MGPLWGLYGASMGPVWGLYGACVGASVRACMGACMGPIWSLYWASIWATRVPFSLQGDFTRQGALYASFEYMRRLCALSCFVNRNSNLFAVYIVGIKFKYF